MIKIKSVALLSLTGLIFSRSHAAIVVKYASGSVEQLQSALLSLQVKGRLLGFAKNEYDLGMAYYEGNLVKRNPQKAAEWLLKAAQKNHAPAMFMLGRMLLVGDGIQKM